MFDEIYHGRVLELAADIPNIGRLADAQGTAEKVSRICGSVVNADVILDKDGRIIEIGFDPRACALGQASTSVLSRNAIGKTLDDIVAARDALKAMLKENAEPPEGDFWELRHLQGVRDYPQRHGSVLLAFEAVIAAMQDALSSENHSRE